MELVNLQFRYGKEHVGVKLPSENLISICRPRTLPKIKNVNDRIRKALTDPIASESLGSLVTKNMTISLLISDITRPCPSATILPPILKELNRLGVPDGNIQVVFATGMHRKHKPEEHAYLLGNEMLRRLKIQDHDVLDKTNFQYIGETSHGTEVSINKDVINSDFLIGIANIDIHYFAGYSGGSKSLLPGVSSFQTIEQNHSLMVLPESVPGRADGNPVREDTEEGARLANLNFIVNVVLNDQKEIVDVMAGDFVKAHRAGIKSNDYMYKTPIDTVADIVIASAGGFPKDINLYQAQKGLDNAQYAVKKGGTIILLAECRDGFGERTFKRWLLEAKKPQDVIERQKEGFVLGGHKAYAIARIAKEVEILLVSSFSENWTNPSLLNPVNTLNEALNQSLIRHGRDASIIVMPYAGSTLPIIQKSA
jgi:nickel-dependent lactate racemase